MKWLANLAKSLGIGLGEFSPSCREAVRLKSLAVDRPLTTSQRIGLRLHLMICQWCRRYDRQVEFLRKAAHTCDDHEAALPAQTLRPEVRERIKRRLQDRPE